MVAQATWQTRGFPPPWSVEGTEACFIVRDADRQALAYVYFEDSRGGARRLTYDEARRIAANIQRPAPARGLRRRRAIG